jgi:ketosteroid isomerase-like protein
MFRNRLFAFAVLGILAVGCAKTPPPQDVAADKTKLQADALSWFDRAAAADSEGVANLYAEDAILMPPGGPAVTGKAAIKSYIGGMLVWAKAGGMSLKPGTVTGSEVSGDVGWISGTYTVADSTGATIDGGSYMSTHRRTNGTWLYERDIWNSDRPAPPPAKAGKK